MFKNWFTDKGNFYRFLIILVITSYVSALIVFYFEHGENPNYDSFVDALYWWVLGLTTVGAGHPPITDLGKVFGMITMISGGLIYLSVFSEIIIWTKSKADEKYSGIKKFKGKEHVVIVGYNDLTIGLINFLDKILLPDIDIVLVTSLIENNPNPDRVSFVRSNPLASSTLHNVSLRDASIVFIVARDEVSDKKVDMNTLMIGSMIEKINKKIFTFAEVSKEKNSKDIENFGVNSEFTFLELLDDIQNPSPASTHIVKKMPESLRKRLLKKIYHLQAKKLVTKLK